MPIEIFLYAIPENIGEYGIYFWGETGDYLIYFITSSWLIWVLQEMIICFAVCPAEATPFILFGFFFVYPLSHGEFLNEEFAGPFEVMVLVTTVHWRESQCIHRLCSTIQTYTCSISRGLEGGYLNGGLIWGLALWFIHAGGLRVLIELVFFVIMLVFPVSFI